MKILIEVDNILRDLNNSFEALYDEFRNENDTIVNSEIDGDEYLEQKMVVANPTLTYVYKSDNRNLFFKNSTEFQEFRETYTYEFLFSSPINENIKKLFTKFNKCEITFFVNTSIIQPTLINKKTTLHYFIKNEIEFDGVLFYKPHNFNYDFILQYNPHTNKIQLVQNDELILTDTKNLQNVLNFFQTIQ